MEQLQTDPHLTDQEGVVIMGWFGVEQDFYERPKFRKLMKLHGCGACESMGILIVLWSWGVENATKDGLILEADQDYLENYLFGKNIKGSIQYGNIVPPLIESGWLDCTDGKLYIHDWDFWQSALYKAKERREIDAERKREYRAKNRVQIPVPEESSEVGSLLPEDHKGDLPETESGKSEYTKDFETFYKVYPRHVGKGDAYKKYRARINDGYSPEELLTAATNYARECTKQGTEQKFIKHPKTFLSDTMPFLDFIPSQKNLGQTKVEIGSLDTDNPFRQGV